MAHQLCLLASIWEFAGDHERRDAALDLAARLLDRPAEPAQETHGRRMAGSVAPTIR
jgi:hypothetical protein